ncbi:hypothetical protein [Enterococcus rivorum]|uniref:Uncharacterized protein n=1 Tax=Enterococcus rivorum TaxID=762845 RepID=A0A1E5KSN7_9ENTE|nr:hypothetical protein [Enterococcus rivorum]MBP2098172.1 hypothetical protein [Enterococcus rivorum]OEH80905.1 hypothetical protein BCR26_06650 [Enterococcus rivorum]
MSNDQKLSHNRKIMYWGTLGFLLIALLLAFFQTTILKWLFSTQLPLSLQNALLLFSNANWLELLIQKITNGTILVGVVLILEILLFIGFIVFFLIYLWRMRKNGRWALSDILLFIGYSMLLVGSIVCGGFVVSTTVETMTTLQSNFQKVSPTELQLLVNNLTHFLEKFTFSLSTIFKDISTLIQGAQKIIGDVKQVAATPSILQNWLDILNQWRLYFIVAFTGSFLVLITGMLLRLRTSYPQLLRKKKKQPLEDSSTTEERLVRILEQQQELLEKIERRETAEPTEQDSTEKS